MAEGIITLQDLITDDALNFGAKYAENVQLAINQNNLLKQSAKDMFEVHQKFQKAQTQDDYAKAKNEEALAIQKATNAIKEREAALVAAEKIKKQALITEKQAIATQKESLDLDVKKAKSKKEIAALEIQEEKLNQQKIRSAKEEASLQQQLQKIEIEKARLTSEKIKNSGLVLKNLQEEERLTKQKLSVIQQENKLVSEQSEEVKKQLTVWKEQDQLEKSLISTKKKNELATESTNRALIKERQTLNETNKEIKNSLTAMGRLTLERDKARKSVQDFQAKLALGEGLSNKEQRELGESIKAFEKYNKAVTVIKNSTGQFQENVGNYPKQFQAIGNGLRQLLPALGLVAGLKLAFDFAKESRDIAIQAKGVQFAFERLGDAGVDAFEKVKKSTRGTLSDLDIKTALVDFDNFNISLEETDTLFEFLAVRAAQTGKSVEELQSSLVEGLSKESKLRIDNLGISASELNEELAKTPDFVQAVANIAKREVAEAGDILDEAGSSQSRWNADLKDFQVTVGNGFVAKFSDGLYEAGSALLRLITPTKRLVGEIQKEQVELNLLVTKITDVNTGNEERERLIVQLKNQYPAFLQFLDEEKTDNESLSTALSEVNQLYIKRIALQTQQETIQGLLEKSGKEAFRQAKAQVEVDRELAQINSTVLKGSLDLTNTTYKERIQLVADALRQDAKFSENTRTGTVSAMNDEARALERINKLTGVTVSTKIRQDKVNKELNEEQELMNALEENLGFTIEQINKIFEANTKAKEDNNDATKELTDEEKKALEARKKLLESDKFNLEKTVLQQSIDAEKTKLDNTKLTAGQRLSANIDYFTKSVALLEFEKQHAIENAKGRKDELKRIELEYNDDISKLEKERADNSEAILADAFEKAKKKIEAKKKLELDAENVGVVALQKRLQEELAVEGISASEKFRLIKKYEDDVLKLKQESAKKQLEVQIAAIEQELAINKALDPEQRLALEQILADAKIALSDQVTENAISNAEIQAEIELRFLELKRKVISDASQSIADSLGLDSQNIEGLFNSFLNTAEATGDAVIDKFNKVSQTIAQIGSVTAVTGDIFQSIFDANIDKIDDAIDANDEYYERQLQLAENDKEQQDLLRQEQELKRQELEEKKRQEQIKAAKFAKAFSIFQIGITTAQAVIAALAPPPIGLGPILGIPLAVTAGALGLLQIGAVLAKPIPKYELGTQNHPGGPAEVAEKRPEVIKEPGKKPFIQYDRAVLKLAKGTKVYKSVEDSPYDFEAMKTAAIMTSFQVQAHKLNAYEAGMAFDYNNDDVVKELQLTRQAIKDNRTNVRVQQSKIDYPYEIFRFKNTHFTD